MGMRFNDIEWVLKPDEKLNILNIYKDIINLIKGRKPRTLGSIDVLERVLFIYIDGIDYKAFNKAFKDLETIRITSIYPATTANIVTSLATASKPSVHGIYEWNLYVPSINMLIQPLLMKHYKSRYDGHLCDEGIKPKAIVGGRRLFKTLLKENIRVKAFLRGYITRSCYAKYILGDIEIQPYINVTDLSISIRKSLKEDLKNEKLFYYIYIEGVDSIGHRYGAYNEEFYKDLRYTVNILLEELREYRKEEIYIVITSDHGFDNINQLILLDDDLPVIKRYLAKDSEGIYLVSGSPRNVYLHVKEGYLDKVKMLLEDKLSDKALILTRDELIEAELVERGRYINRIGDIIILPKPGIEIWTRHFKGEEIRVLRGGHGGLSIREVEIPFMIYKIGDLIRDIDIVS